MLDLAEAQPQHCEKQRQTGKPRFGGQLCISVMRHAPFPVYHLEISRPHSKERVVYGSRDALHQQAPARFQRPLVSLPFNVATDRTFQSNQVPGRDHNGAGANNPEYNRAQNY